MRNNCLHCKESFEAKRSTAKFCSDKCRVSHSREVYAEGGEANDDIVSDVTLSHIKDGIAYYAIDEPEWRKSLIEAILSGQEPGILENHPHYGIVISGRSAADGRRWQAKNDAVYRALSHKLRKEREHWSNPKE